MRLKSLPVPLRAPMKSSVGAAHQMDRPIVVADRIVTASAVVALESSVLAQGLPSPANLESAEAQSVAVSRSGAEPAVVGVIGGRIVVGADTDQVRALASRRATWKVTVRDLPYVVTRKLDGATTVSATVFAAERVGIEVMATGGIGGIHFGTADVSADLPQLARSRAEVVCSGPKHVADGAATLEWLETWGVLVVGYRTDRLPGFLARWSPPARWCWSRTHRRRPPWTPTSWPSCPPRAPRRRATPAWSARRGRASSWTGCTAAPAGAAWPPTSRCWRPTPAWPARSPPRSRSADRGGHESGRAPYAPSLFVVVLGLDVVVEVELPRVRAQADRVDLALALVADPGLDHVGGEDVALEHEGVVLLQRVERLVERARDLRHSGQLLGRQLVEVLVERAEGLDLVADPVQTGHQHGRERQVGVAGRVGDPELDPLGPGAARVQRDPGGGRAVALRVHQVDRRLVAGHQPPVAVGGRVGQRGQRRRVGQQATDVPAGHVRQPGVARLVVEQRLAAAPQALVGVHARAVVLEDRLGHEGDRLAGAPGDVLVEHHLVGHAQQRVEAHVDLGLPGGADLVVVDLDVDARPDHLQDHLAAQVLVVVGGRDREVALLVAGLVAEVAAALLGAGVPGALDRVDEVVGGELVLVEAHGVEDVELALRAPVGGLGDTAARQVGLGLARDVARVAGVGLPGHGVTDETVQDQRRVLRERVEHGRRRVREQEHVRLLDLLEPPDRRAVEPEPLLERLLGQLRGRHREMLHQPRQVREAQVDDLDPAVPDQAENVADRIRHAGCLLRIRGNCPGACRGQGTTLATGLCRPVAEVFRARYEPEPTRPCGASPVRRPGSPPAAPGARAARRRPARPRLGSGRAGRARCRWSRGAAPALPAGSAPASSWPLW